MPDANPAKLLVWHAVGWERDWSFVLLAARRAGAKNSVLPSRPQHRFAGTTAIGQLHLYRSSTATPALAPCRASILLPFPATTSFVFLLTLVCLIASVALQPAGKS